MTGFWNTLGVDGNNAVLFAVGLLTKGERKYLDAKEWLRAVVLKLGPPDGLLNYISHHPRPCWLGLVVL